MFIGVRIRVRLYVMFSPFSFVKYPIPILIGNCIKKTLNSNI